MISIDTAFALLRPRSIYRLRRRRQRRRRSTQERTPKSCALNVLNPVVTGFENTEMLLRIQSNPDTVSECFRTNLLANKKRVISWLSTNRYPSEKCRETMVCIFYLSVKGFTTSSVTNEQLNYSSRKQPLAERFVTAASHKV